MVALEEYGINLCKQGTKLPGWEARTVAGNLSWTVDALQIGDAMGVDLRTPAKPITPTQAKDRGLLSEDVLKSLAARKSGGITLKRVDHARAKRILNNG